MKARPENAQTSVENRIDPAREETPASDMNRTRSMGLDEESLEATEVSRDARADAAMQRNHAANRMAAANRTTRLLWIALILSLIAHVIVPIYLVTAMTKPEKVALMDGTPSTLSLRKSGYCIDDASLPLYKMEQRRSDVGQLPGATDQDAKILRRETGFRCRRYFY